MDCVCHCEPAYWQKDSRMRAGGWWRCAVAKRESARAIDAARRDVKTQRQRDRYDADPIYRLGKNLRDGSRRRAITLKRNREADPYR